MVEPFFLSLEQSVDPRLVGGKAAGLRRLHAAGFAVPHGLCVTTALYQQCLSAAGIDGPAEWQVLLRSSAEQRAMAITRMHQHLGTALWPSGCQTELASRLAELSPAADTRWAVRHPATNEDADQASAAGLYSTFLGGRPMRCRSDPGLLGIAVGRSGRAVHVADGRRMVLPCDGGRDSAYDPWGDGRSRPFDSPRDRTNLASPYYAVPGLASALVG